MSKYNIRSSVIFGVAQIAENIPVAISEQDSAGTIDITSGSTAVTGTGTKFLTEVTPKAYLFRAGGILVGQVKSVTSNTALVLKINAPTTSLGTAFSIDFGAKNALAVIAPTYSLDIASEEFQFSGDELSRDTQTIITDKSVKVEFETFMPKLGSIAGADPLITEVPMKDWMRSVNFPPTLSTDGSGSVLFSNSLASNTFISLQFRRKTLDSNTDKTYTITDCRGTLDANNQVGSRVKLKFSLMGNLQSLSEKAEVIPDFAAQKSLFATTLSANSVTLSRLLVYSSETEPVDAGVSNICFSKFDASNLAGFSFERYKLSCVDSWSKEATASDVTFTIIADAADATYVPDNNLEKNHSLRVTYSNGGLAGEIVDLYWHKLQLVNVTDSEVAKYVGQDLPFKNVGITDIRLS